MNIGDKVHLGFGVKGGAGFEGTVIKIEGETVTIKNPEGRTFTGPLKNVTISNSFQNGVAKAEQEIMNKANSVGVKLKNIDSNLMKQLEEKGFYGLIDQLKRGKITEDQAKRSLAGDKSAIPLPSTTQWGDEPLIFGRTHAEIARMQKSGKLRK